MKAVQPLVASMLVVAVLLLGFLAASPDAHHKIHDDAHAQSHVCAVTLAATGFCDTAPAMPAASPERQIVFEAPAAAVPFHWSTPCYWHPPAQTPPTAA